MSQAEVVVKTEASDSEEIPEDFFDELAEADFIEEMIDGDAMENGRSNSDGGEAKREDSPRMARCMAEIETLTKDIQRRKQKLERELIDKGYTEDQLRRKVKRASDSQTRERERRRDRARDRDRDRSRSRSRTRSRSRSRQWHAGPNRVNRYRQRSRSPKNRRRPSPKRSSSTHKNLTFLEELAQTFAEKGQAFPEKDLILNQQKLGRPNHMGQPMHMMEPSGMPMAMGMPPMVGTGYPPMNQPVAYPTIAYPPSAYFGGGMDQMNAVSVSIEAFRANNSLPRFRCR